MSGYLVVCDTETGCPTRDGSLQPQGTAFDRVPTDEFPPPPGCVLVPDDGTTVLYIQNSGPRLGPPSDEELKTYTNDAAAIADGLPYGKYYSSPSGYTVQLKRPQ